MTPKQKLITLLESKKAPDIKNAITLNKTLNILTEDEVFKIVYNQYDWNKEGGNWVLLEEYPNHPTWKKIITISLQKYGLKSLPSSIENLTNLQVLILRDNFLTTLPKEIGNLKELRQISLMGNREMKHLPKEMGKLRKLEKLNLKFTDLTWDNVPKNLHRLVSHNLPHPF